MNTYLFIREDHPVCGRSVHVLRNGKSIGQLNLFSPEHRRHSIQKLQDFLGERNTTQLVAFGQSAMVQTEEFVSF